MDTIVLCPVTEFTSSTKAETKSFRYTGCEFDTETSLSHYRARYYDPGAGRFLSEDPLGFFGGINKYNYVYSDPVNGMDNRGTCPCPDPQEIDEKINEAEDVRQYFPACVLAIEKLKPGEIVQIGSTT
jgi:RHS repeat-associated protein